MNCFLSDMVNCFLRFLAGWCSGQGLSFAIVRLWVRILVTPHAAGRGELSTHRSQLALFQLNSVHAIINVMSVLFAPSGALMPNKVYSIIIIIIMKFYASHIISRLNLPTHPSDSSCAQNSRATIYSTPWFYPTDHMHFD